MVTQQGLTYVLNTRFGYVEGFDRCLEEIVTDIYFYLFSFENSWLYLTIGKSYFQRCCRSWIRVSSHLEKFLFDPKINYSMLVSVLEQERKKFSPRSFYGKELNALEGLITRGPAFAELPKTDQH